MSSAGKRAERLPDDDYATPGWATRLLLPHLGWRGVVSVLDPCAGEGKLLDEVKSWALHVHGRDVETCAIEIDPGRASACEKRHGPIVIGDALDERRWPGVDLVVTNPPYSLALPFVERALENAGEVAMLLRLAWLASGGRAAFHREHPADVLVFPKRPSFAHSFKCKPCQERIMQPTTVLRLGCPRCGVRMSLTKNDSADYAWFVWGEGRGNRWWILGEED